MLTLELVSLGGVFSVLEGRSDGEVWAYADVGPCRRTSSPPSLTYDHISSMCVSVKYRDQGLESSLVNAS